MNDTQEKSTESTNYLDVILSLNYIIPLVSFILIAVLVCRMLMINGLDRYFQLNEISIPTEEIKYTILKIIGIFLVICSILFIIYYFTTSPIFTYSFRFTDVRTNYSLLDTIYSISFTIATFVILLLPVLIGMFDISSNDYKIYVGVVGALLSYSMFLYQAVQNKQLNPSDNLDKKMIFLIGCITMFCVLIGTLTMKIPPSWILIFSSILIFLLCITIFLYNQQILNDTTSNDMKWLPKSFFNKLIYLFVFVPLKIMYYYPYIFIQYIIPGLYSMFLSPSIFIYTILFIVGLVMMKYVLPYFEITITSHIYFAWVLIYCIMLYTNNLVNSKSTFFTMRQAFLFLCLFLIFIAYLLFVKKSDTMPEYLKLYLTTFVFITGVITIFLFLYMAKAEQKEFSDCDLYKNVFPSSFTSLDNQEKLNGLIPTLKRTLLAYIAVCVSCYVMVYLANKLFPMKSGIIGQITGIVIVLLILMIFVSLFTKLKGENNSNFKISNSFINFILSFFSFLVEFVLYIPCKLHDIILSIGSANKSINKTTIFFIILDIIFILLYIYGSYIRKHIYLNGITTPNIPELLGLSSQYNTKNLVSKVGLKFPITIKEYDMNVSNFIAASNDETMNNTENTIYNYSLSFWFYIDTNTPSASIAYSKYTPILSYGSTPIIFYNYLKQSLIVASTSSNPIYPKLDLTDVNDPNGRYNDSNLKVIYETTTIPLQKWNNIVTVYNSSVVDIFINSKLIKSNISLSPIPENILTPSIPQINSLTAGYTNGIYGKICNIIYYDKSIGLEQIERLYLSVKDNNPPIFYPSLL